MTALDDAVRAIVTTGSWASPSLAVALEIAAELKRLRASAPAPPAPDRISSADDAYHALAAIVADWPWIHRADQLPAVGQPVVVRLPIRPRRALPKLPIAVGVCVSAQGAIYVPDWPGPHAEEWLPIEAWIATGGAQS